MSPNRPGVGVLAFASALADPAVLAVFAAFVAACLVTVVAVSRTVAGRERRVAALHRSLLLATSPREAGIASSLAASVVAGRRSRVALSLGSAAELTIMRTAGPTTDELRGTRYRLADLTEQAARALATGSTYDGDSRLLPLRGRGGKGASVHLPLHDGGRLLGVLAVSAQPRRLRGAAGQLEELVADLTAVLTRLEESGELALGRRRYRALAELDADAVAVLSADGTLVYANPAAARLGVWDPTHVQSLRAVHPDDRGGVTDALAAAAAAPGAPVKLELRLRSENGRPTPYEGSVTSMVADPDIRGLVVRLRDVSVDRRIAAELADGALRDSLTGAANEPVVRDRITAAFGRAARRNRRLAVVVVDPGTDGPVDPELLLVEASRRLALTLRAGDTLGRVDQGLLAVVVEEVASAEEAEQVARRMLASVAGPWLAGGRGLALSASVGVAVTGDDGGPDRLLADAKAAALTARRAGGGTVRRYEPAGPAQIAVPLAAAGSIRSALDRGELALLFQPVTVPTDGRVVGAEALLRWHPPGGEVVGPLDTLEASGQAGLLGAVGAWVLSEACRAAGRARAVVADFVVAVNLSAAQLSRPRLVEEVRRALDAADLAPAALSLEISERDLAAAGAGDIPAVLAQLHAIGVRLCVDDFGSGHAPLHAVAELPVDEVKLERSIVRGLGNGDGAVLARSLIEAATTLSLTTVAKGVETPEQLQSLGPLGCELAQGFLVGRPADEASLTGLLRAQAAIRRRTD